MSLTDLASLRSRLGDLSFEPGSPQQIAEWRQDFEDQTVSLAIEGIPLDHDDQAMFRLLLDEGVPPAVMVQLLDGFYKKDV